MKSYVLLKPWKSFHFFACRTFAETEVKFETRLTLVTSLVPRLENIKDKKIFNFKIITDNILILTNHLSTWTVQHSALALDLEAIGAHQTLNSSN